MRRLIFPALAVWFAAAVFAHAQSLDDLNMQIHGYATQGFLYTTNNNIFTTNSSNGSPAWTEAVMNVTAQPQPKLRVGVQARYFLLGNFGNAITLDWAEADYKVNDKFGVRFGKVKIPTGLFNEIQDIDPAYMWALLPQSIYPITSRNSVLAEYGGLVYGTLALGKSAGKIEYRGWSGEIVVGPNDGYWVTMKEQGIALTNGLHTPETGVTLHWITPAPGLMIGASYARLSQSNSPFTDTYVVPTQGITITTPGTMVLNVPNWPDYFVRWEKDRVMAAGEYERSAGNVVMSGLSPLPQNIDTRSWYLMTSYRFTDKLIAGVYVTQDFNHQAALGPSRYFKDWVVSSRYDFNQYLYMKAEEHFIEGTAVGYDIDLNTGGLQPSTKMTILKLGVSF